jgi:hypothetical protein
MSRVPRPTLLPVLLLICATAAPARADEALQEARRLAAAGAAQLALERVERLQPADPAAPGWAQWEALRCELLARLARHAPLLARAAAWPAAMSGQPLVDCLRRAARAAAAAGQGATARRYAARLLWQSAVDTDTARALRLAVIDAYVADGAREDALRSMLRFDQDYRPLDEATAARFAEALIGLDAARDAVNWLASLDEANPVKLLLRLKAGLATPEATAAQARALAARRADPGYWRAAAEAARYGDDALLLAEAAEHALNLAAPQAREQAAQQLWDSYRALARRTANEARLLTGDDGGWADLAARRLAGSPVAGRALFAELARHGRSPEVRRSAQLQLVFSLISDGLDLTALRLAGAHGFEPAAIDPQARYLLGAAAERRGDAATAVRYWEGLAPPPGSGEAQWALRLARAHELAQQPALAARQYLRAALAAGAPEAAVAAARLAAARNLARAGYREDARAQLDWVLGHAKDPAQVAAAREELARLQP